MSHSYNEELQIGDRIAGRYEVLGVIGQGSMGVVYKCRHDMLGKVVAIKTLRLRERTADDRSQKRFEREARLASRLDHPNLISVHDFGCIANGDPYLVMDFVSGKPLYDIMKRERYLIAERAVSLFTQVCDGLFHAHQRGVIHRDLKPANILVTQLENGIEVVKIVDLGVAKIVQGEEDAEAITMTGEVCGSPIYLSPEQCMYQELDPRTDIYSLGVCLYECLMGQPPLRGATVYDTIYMHVHDQPRPFSAIIGGNPEVPKKLEEIVFKCLAKNPNDRFETMMQLKQELIASLKTSAVEASPVKVLPPESLFGSVSPAAPKKTSGEVPRPGKTGEVPRSQNKSGELPAVPADNAEQKRKSQSESRRPAADDDDDSDDDELPQEETPRPGKRNQSGASRNRSTEDLASAGGAKQSKEFKTSGQHQAKRSENSSTVNERGAKKSRLRREKGPNAGITASMQTADERGSGEGHNLKKILVLATCLSIIFGLSIGLGFAFFLTSSNTRNQALNTSNSNNAAPSHGATTETPSTTSESTQTSLNKHEATGEATGSKPAKTKTSAVSTAKKHATGGLSSDLSKYLDDDKPIAVAPQGSQSKYFSIVKNQHARSTGGFGGFQQMPSMPSVQGGAATYRSTQALAKLKDNPLIQKMKEFAASQGMPIPGATPPAQNQSSGNSNPFFGGGGIQMPSFKPPGQNASEALRPGSLLQQSNDSGHAQGGMGNQEQAATLCNEGTELCNNKQFSAACQKFEAAYKLDSKNSEIQQMYAYALNSRALELNKDGHYSDAVEYEKKAINLSPDRDVYRKNMHNFSENLKAQQAGTLP